MIELILWSIHKSSLKLCMFDFTSFYLKLITCVNWYGLSPIIVKPEIYLSSYNRIVSVGQFMASLGKK